MSRKPFRLAFPALVAGALAALAFTAAGYGQSRHHAARTAGSIEVFSLWGGSEQDAFLKVADAFTKSSGIAVKYTSGRDFITDITARLAAGNPPDIAIVPRPGYLQSLVKQGALKDLGTMGLTSSYVQTRYGPSWLGYGTVGGKLYGVPAKANSKSFIWYRPDQFKKYQFKALNKPVQDEEHQTWSLSFVDAQGAERRIDWQLASTPEYRQMMSKHAQIKEMLEPPFVVEYAGKPTGPAAEAEEPEGVESAPEGADAQVGKAAAPGTKRGGKSQEPVEKQTPRELFEYVIEQGRRDYQVQRYKGLGEMTASQLWETTMDPERRTLLSVKLEDIAETEAIFTTLMGEDVEARRKFIEDNALDVKNLDI